MTTLNRILTAVVLCLVLALYAAGSWGTRQKSERSRLEANRRTMLEREREYMVRDSLNAVSVGLLTLRADEFREQFKQLNGLVKDMGLRLKRIENISQNATESRYDIAAPVRDTIVILDTIPVAAHSLTYKDPWLELDGIIAAGEFKGSLVTHDTLTQIVHHIPRRFLFLRYGTKELRQEIVSSNPHTRITYSRNIRIGK